MPRYERRTQRKPSNGSGRARDLGWGKDEVNAGYRRNSLRGPEKRTPGSEGAHLTTNHFMPMAQYHHSQMETNDSQADTQVPKGTKTQHK